MIYRMILLTLQQRTGSERSISAVYYLLKGNPSIQTIQDTYLFQLEAYFGIYRTLHKNRFMATVRQLESEGMLEETATENHYKLTNKASKWLQANEAAGQLPYLNGMKWKQTADVFYKRLLLITQVWTNAQKRYTAYIPIVEDREVEQWVKNLYRSTKHRVDSSLAQLYKELFTLLDLLPERQAAVWVYQLTGYQSIGMTFLQLADTYKVEEEDIYLITMHVNHFLLKKIEERPENFPLLVHIARVNQVEKKLTASASKTKEMLQKQASLEGIAQARQLKMNTIYDHIVEISLQDPSFSLAPYVEKKAQQKIMRAIQKANSFRLRKIKEQTDDTITYFQIRLVLTRIKEN